jgi:hypothetical protein
MRRLGINTADEQEAQQEQTGTQERAGHGVFGKEWYAGDYKIEIPGMNVGVLAQ